MEDKSDDNEKHLKIRKFLMSFLMKEYVKYTNVKRFILII